LEAAARGEGGLVLLRGPGGSGKTRLLELLAGWAAEAGMPVYRGAAWDSSEAPPLWPWREVVRDATEGHEPSELVGDRAPALLALAGLGPTDGGPLTPRDVQAARLERFTAGVALLRALAARGPLLVLLDDLHAADEQTVELTRFAARRLRGSPVCLPPPSVTRPIGSIGPTRLRTLRHLRRHFAAD
jgi:energy-coupling factor transporter ATP-binding protein EcfA2